VADFQSVLLTGLHSPFGITLVGDRLFVADTDTIRSYPYREGQQRIDEPGSILTELPAGRINHHWTKNLVAGPSGQFLYVSVGSNSKAGENGLAAEEGRAQIWEVNARTGEHRSYATGLRNPNGLSFAPGPTPVLWTAVNERDELGSDLVPGLGPRRWLLWVALQLLWPACRWAGACTPQRPTWSRMPSPQTTHLALTLPRSD
jgi:glucose/arabinose dehydrogenase